MWDQTSTDVFNEIKYKIKHADILILPDFTKPFIIYCDAADRGIGYYLAQEENGCLHTVFLGGRVMTKTEKRYASLDQELLAVYFAVKRCSIYLYGHDFIIYRPQTINLPQNLQRYCEKAF